jgi:hypothetical protein
MFPQKKFINQPTDERPWLRLLATAPVLSGRLAPLNAAQAPPKPPQGG